MTIPSSIKAPILALCLTFILFIPNTGNAFGVKAGDASDVRIKSTHNLRPIDWEGGERQQVNEGELNGNNNSEILQAITSQNNEYAAPDGLEIHATNRNGEPSNNVPQFIITDLRSPDFFSPVIIEIQPGEVSLPVEVPPPVVNPEPIIVQSQETPAVVVPAIPIEAPVQVVPDLTVGEKDNKPELKNEERQQMSEKDIKFEKLLKTKKTILKKNNKSKKVRSKKLKKSKQKS